MDTSITEETQRPEETNTGPVIYTDAMVDIETSGLEPNRTAILQISIVLFNAKTKEVNPNVFNRMLRIPNWRHWDQSTLSWWSKQRAGLLQEILARGEDPAVVLKDMITFVRQSDNSIPRFWSKPTHFDFMFIQSYLKDFDLFMPFCYRSANDMNSFIRALYFPEPVPNLNIEFQGEAHNAIFDTLHQIKLLFAHMEDVGK